MQYVVAHRSLLDASIPRTKKCFQPPNQLIQSDSAKKFCTASRCPQVRLVKFAIPSSLQVANRRDRRLNKSTSFITTLLSKPDTLIKKPEIRRPKKSARRHREGGKLVISVVINEADKRDPGRTQAILINRERSLGMNMGEVVGGEERAQIHRVHRVKH